MLGLSDNNDHIWKAIKYSPYKILCVNDNADLTNTDLIQKQFLSALDYKLSEKSSFEI